MPRNIESSLNRALGRLLSERNPEWVPDRTLFAECTDVLVGNSAARPDLLVQPPGGQPVAIETEFRAGPQVEREAESRLGEMVKGINERIESAISVGMPEFLRQDPGRLNSANLNYATHHLDVDESVTRWPETDWLQGSVDRLADAVELVSLSEKRLQAGAAILEDTIEGVSLMLHQQISDHALGTMAELLHQADSDQTTKMAVAILVNAFVFHYAIEDQPGIPGLYELRAKYYSASSIDAAWGEVLRVNYWPVFSIAREILRRIPDRLVPRVAARLNDASEQVAALGSTTFHDLTGRLFQKLIADRKYLATFYTLPESAQLLADLAIDRLNIDWSDGDAICGLRVADFACGTGTLISAVQRAIYRRFRRGGGNDRHIHRKMVERSLIASDIMPAATHITASMLSSPHPGLVYRASMVHTLPYGKNEEGEVALGALSLLTDQHVPSLFSTSDMQIVGGDMSEREGKPSRLDVADGTCDVVIMNPPFTRPTNHAIAHVPVPSFAGFNTSEDE